MDGSVLAMENDKDDSLIQKSGLEGLGTSAVLWIRTVDHTSNDQRSDGHDFLGDVDTLTALLAAQL
jgi:hypothetical protein